MSSAETAAPTHSTPQAAPKRESAWLVPLVVLVFAALLLTLVLSRWNFWRSSGVQTTNDAYVHANIVPLSTMITGTLRTLAVNDYQPVQAGQLIAQIDDSNAQAQLEEAESALAAAEAALHDNQVQKTVQAEKIAQSRHQVDVSVQDQQAALSQVSGVDAEKRRLDEERRRQENLYKDAATTRRALEQATAEDDQTQASLIAARANAQKAHDGVQAQKSVLAQSEQDLRLLEAKDQDLRAQIEQRRAAVKSAQVQLSYTQIHSPVNGMVTDRKAFPGQLVSPGMEVIALVEGDLWVQANYEETQLAGIRIGDTAEIRVDAVPGQVFHGHVLDVSPASGSQTALLPPDNASGNFTKIIQRIPVKVSLEDGDHHLNRLRPGFSCEVRVHPSEAR